jgi:RNA polymerase sigma factor (TIGR02999 family)
MDVKAMLARSHGDVTAALACGPFKTSMNEPRAEPDWQSLYPQLRAIARQSLRRHQSLTLLQTTDLVHDAWLRLSAQSQLPTTQRLAFLAYAARTIRSVIVDAARARLATKRGGHATHVDLDELVEIEADAEQTAAMQRDVLGLHDALQDLAKLDANLAQLVELRYFAGLTEVEVVELTGRSRASVQRDWAKARAVLLELLQS